MVKKFIKTLSVFCVFAVFVHTIAFLSVFSIKADDSCPGALIIYSSEDLSNVNISNSITFTLEPDFSLIQPYSAQIWYKKNDSSIAPTAYGGLTSGLSGNQEKSIIFSTTGNYSFYVSYTLQGTGCTQKESNHLTASITNEGLGNGGSITNISIDVQDKILRNQTTTIKMRVDDGNGQKVEMHMNKGGSDCPVDSPTDSCWVDLLITYTYTDSDTWYHETDWTPGPSSNLGNHIIKIKTYDGTNTSPTGIAVAYINLCEEGTDLNSCSSGSSSGTDNTGAGGTSETPTDTGPVVSLPGGDIPIHIGGSLLGFSLSRGSGIGGLINMIVNFSLMVIGGLAFISILVGGIQYITAGGDSAKTEKAKKSIIFSAIAIILVTFSTVIINLVNTLLK